MGLTKNCVGRIKFVSVEVRKVVDVVAYDSRYFCHCYTSHKTITISHYRQLHIYETRHIVQPHRLYKLEKKCRNLTKKISTKTPNKLNDNWWQTKGLFSTEYLDSRTWKKIRKDDNHRQRI